MWSRRGLLATVAVSAGCGFRPLYGPDAGSGGAAAGDVASDMAAVRVATIPERIGQLLRRDLDRRFEGSAPGTQARYSLAVQISFGVDPIGYRRDGAITRLRYTATGQWVLSTLSVPPQRLAGGVMPVRTIDSFNIPDLQFFAADSARDALERRVAETLADDIAFRVASAFRRRRDGVAA